MGDVGSQDASPIEPPPLPDEGAVVEGPPPTRRTAARAALALGVAGMLAAGLFAVRSIGSDGAGGATPTAAVERFFDAVAKEDLIGVFETVLPDERELLQTRVQEITKELTRLGVFGEADLADVNGVELEVFGLRFKEEKLASDVVAVVVREGRIRARFDPGGGLLGEFVTDALDRGSRRPTAGSIDFEKDDAVVATVRDGDQWYVSLGYTLAENTRRGAGRVEPTLGQGVAIGSPTPEKAVEDFLRATAGLEVSRLVQLMAPTEARALHDYAQLFIHQVGSAAHDARGLFSAAITDLKVSSRASGSESIVKVERIAFRYEIPDFGVTITFDGDCTVFRFEDEPPERECGLGIAPALPFYLPLDQLPNPDVGFVVIQERGQWFISPTRTVLGVVLGYLKVLDRRDLDAFMEFFQEGPPEGFEPPIIDPIATPTA